MVSSIVGRYNLHRITDIVSDPETNLLDQGTAIYIPSETLLVTIKNKRSENPFKSNKEIEVLMGDKAYQEYFNLLNEAQKNQVDIDEKIISWFKSKYFADHPSREILDFLIDITIKKLP